MFKIAGFRFKMADFVFKNFGLYNRVQIVLILCNAVAKVCNGNRNWSAFGQLLVSLPIKQTHE